MSKDTDKSFFILSPLANKPAGLYQQLFSGIVGYKELGNRIIREIKAAHAFREIGQVRELSRILINIPIKEFQLIAQYYLVWCDCRESKFHNAPLERLAEQTRTYKTRALISRAAIEGYQMNVERELYFYIEASKSQPTISEYIDILKSIAVIKAKEGFHKSALRELESLIPIIRHAEPLVYFDVLNSLTVELCEAGRKQEAQNVSRIVLASPFIRAYPEWQETARDLREPSRSSVATSPTPKLLHNVVHMPVVDHVESKQMGYNPPARVVNLQRWKTKMAKDEKPDEELSSRQIVFKIIDFYTDENTTDEQRHKLWEAAQKIMLESNPPDPESDDTEGA